MIYVIRLNDGSCGVVDAQDEFQAEEILVDSEDLFNDETDKIISIRSLSCPLVTRWSFDRKDSEDTAIDELCGILALHVTDEIFEHEYPTLVKVHEESFDKLSNTESEIYRKSGHQGTLDVLDRYENTLRTRVRKAIDFEIKRFSGAAAAGDLTAARRGVAGVANSSNSGTSQDS